LHSINFLQRTRQQYIVFIIIIMMIRAVAAGRRRRCGPSLASFTYCYYYTFFLCSSTSTTTNTAVSAIPSFAIRGGHSSSSTSGEEEDHPSSTKTNDPTVGSSSSSSSSSSGGGGVVLDTTIDGLGGMIPILDYQHDPTRPASSSSSVPIAGSSRRNRVVEQFFASSLEPSWPSSMNDKLNDSDYNVHEQDDTSVQHHHQQQQKDDDDDDDDGISYLPPLSSSPSIELKNEIHYQATALTDFLIDTRRTLHRQPELMYKEATTSAYIQHVLTTLNIPHTTGWAVNTVPQHIIDGPGGYGVVADIGTGKSPCVLLRADMDALPILERTEYVNDFKSQNIGRMHACGHDGHTTMLLGK
jgi:hypothetical protein